MSILARLVRLLDLVTLSLLERVYLFEDRMCVIAMASEARVIACDQADRLTRLIHDGFVPRQHPRRRRVVAHSIAASLPQRDPQDSRAQAA